MGEARWQWLTKIPVGTLSGCVIAAICYLTLMPHPVPEMDTPLFEGADKVVHACMFGGFYLALYFDFILRRQKQRVFPIVVMGKTCILAIVLAAVFGALIELAQDWMDLGRGGDVTDWLADVAGIMICLWPGVVLARGLFNRR